MSIKEKRINIALSGWSGAGTSTTTLILALLLKRKYYYLGSVIREVGRQLESVSSEEEDEWLARSQDYVQPIVGKTIDKYVDYVLLNKERIILETDLAAFRIGRNSKLYSIFIKTDFETRVKRFVVDGRIGGEELLRKQDEALRIEYQKLWKIDVFDVGLIEEKYNLVIDNSSLDISHTVIEILRRLIDDKSLEDLFEELNRIAEVGSGAKVKYREMLEKQGLLMSPSDMIREMAELFPDEVEKYPDELKRIFRSS